MLADTEQFVGPALAVPSHNAIEKRSADKPLDGFDRLPFDKLRVCDTAGMRGALTRP